MSRENSFVSGWVPDHSVADVLATHQRLLQQTPFVLITSLDSEEHISRLKMLASVMLELDIRPISESPFVLRGTDLERLMREYSLFSGFDELWLCKTQPRTIPPTDASIVAPEQLTSVPPISVQHWMTEWECILGLGDGIGLNFITTDGDLASEIELA